MPINLKETRLGIYMVAVTQRNANTPLQFAPPIRELTMSKLFKRFANDESGATAIEHGLIAALVSIAIIGALTKLGTKLGTNFNHVSGQLK